MADHLTTFLANVRPGAVACQAFEDLPNILYWIKDSELRIRYVNEAFIRWVNLERDEIIGKTDGDLYYTELAEVFMSDDRQVTESGNPLRHKAELCANRFGGVEWRIVSKFPLHDHQGNIIGTTGVSRPLQHENANELPEHYQQFTRMIDYVRSRIHQGITVKRICAYSGMSMSTLERQFRQHLGITPREFLQDIKMSAATELLRNSALSISEIAEKLGYESIATFSRAFKSHTGMAPSYYRNCKA